MSQVGCYVLDVGQGSATLIEGTSGAVLVDAGPGKLTVLEFLERHGVSALAAVFISHADQDHLGGLLSLLAKADTDDFHIGHIYVNPDARDGKLWADIGYQLDQMERRKLVTYTPSLGPDSPSEPLDLGGCLIEILAPSKYMRLRAVDGRHHTGGRQNANAMSAVIRVTVAGEGWVLLPGDLNHLGFADALERGAWRDAAVTVYPHHGGRAGTPAQTKALAKQLVQETRSRAVLFSGRSNTMRFPSKLVIETLLSIGSDLALYCIGLSPVLAECMASMDPCPHHNGTGTLYISPPDMQGRVAIAVYAPPIPIIIH